MVAKAAGTSGATGPCARSPGSGRHGPGPWAKGPSCRGPGWAEASALRIRRTHCTAPPPSLGPGCPLPVHIGPGSLRAWASMSPPGPRGGDPVIYNPHADRCRR